MRQLTGGVKVQTFKGARVIVKRNAAGVCVVSRNMFWSFCVMLMFRTYFISALLFGDCVQTAAGSGTAR